MVHGRNIGYFHWRSILAFQILIVSLYCELCNKEFDNDGALKKHKRIPYDISDKFCLRLQYGLVVLCSSGDYVQAV